MTNDPMAPRAEQVAFDEFDDDLRDESEEDGCDPGEECGRWNNGRLTRQCTKAGSEECDWECPYRSTL